MPNIPAATRNHVWQETAITEVEVSCIEQDPFADIDSEDGPHIPNDIVWAMRLGSGVVLDERHILTAYHVSKCPVIPDVKVVLANGTSRRMWVEKEDSSMDVSRLVLTSVDNFGLGMAPPIVALPVIGEPLCVAAYLPKLGWSCGNVTSIQNGRVLFDAISRKGNSGSAVYDSYGHIVGVMTDLIKCKDGSPDCGTIATLMGSIKF